MDRYEYISIEYITGYKNLREFSLLDSATFRETVIEEIKMEEFNKIDKRFSEIETKKLEKEFKEYVRDLERFFLRGVCVKYVVPYFLENFLQKSEDDYPYDYPFCKNHYFLLADDDGWIYDLLEGKRFKKQKGNTICENIYITPEEKITKIVLANFDSFNERRLITRDMRKSKKSSPKEADNEFREFVKTAVEECFNRALDSEFSYSIFEQDYCVLHETFLEFLDEFLNYDFFIKVLEENNGHYVADSIKRKEEQFIRYFKEPIRFH